MKTTIRFFATFLLIAFTGTMYLSAQAPQKFSYQAVVRNTDGSLITNQSVGIRVSIIEESPSGTPVYIETHSVTTSGQGLITLDVGTGSTGNDFSGIDWGGNDYFLKIELDPSGGTSYTEMGNSQLLAVPYALYSSDSEPQQLLLEGSVLSISDGNTVSLPSVGTSHWTNVGDTILYHVTGKVGVGTTLPTGKLEVKGDGSETDSTVLFEVKRSDGQPVFTVYPSGVEIFVDDTEGKGSKGGFAVGGISGLSKGFTNEFLRVTPDSVRIYINEESSKGSKGGFAIGKIGGKKGPGGDIMSITPENYFIGQESGASIDQGVYNSFMGYQSGTNTTDGNRNIFLGYRSGYSNLDGSNNTFIGNDAGYMNEYGESNIIIGDSSGFNSTGWYNVMLGKNSGFNNGWGHYNVLIGYESGYSNDTAISNVFIGHQAGYTNYGGDWNVFLGTLAGYENTEGQQNVFLGQEAGYQNTTGSYNVFLGVAAGDSNSTGDQNVFLGPRAGFSHKTGNYNTMIGGLTGYKSNDGTQNVYVGQEAGYWNESGNYNTALGVLAGCETKGSYNTYLGNGAGWKNDGSGNIFIGYMAGKDGVGWSDYKDSLLFIDNGNHTWDETFIYGELAENYLYFNADLQVNGEVWADVFNPSDKKFKSDISPLTNALESVKNLNGVTYNWSPESTKGKRFPEGRQIGVIAQEVEAVYPELVSTMRGGDKAVNYSKLTAVLIEAIKEQQAMIEELQQEVAALKAAQE